MTLRLLPSDPLFAEWDFLLTTRAQWLNADCFMDLRAYPVELRLAFLMCLDAEAAVMFQELTR